VAHSTIVLPSLPTPLLLYMLIAMPTKLVLSMIAALHLIFIYILIAISFLGVQRNKTLSLDPVQKRSTKDWLSLSLKFSGFNFSSRNFILLFLFLRHCGVTTSVLHSSQPISCSILILNTLRPTTISFE
jgi:hypothetical protein